VRKMIKKLLLCAALSFALVGGTAAVQAVIPATSAMAPQQAAACTKHSEYTYCLGHYKASGAASVLLCKDWVADGKYDHCGTTRAWRWDSVGHRYTYLSSARGCGSVCGESNLGWSDTDGFYIHSGYRIATNKIGQPDGWTIYTHDGHWRKQSGCFGCYRAVKRIHK